MTKIHITCAECDDLLSGYFEGELDPASMSLVEQHATGCARCQRLVRDVLSIRDSAAVMPHLSPSRDLWSGIESRIEPAVVPIRARRESMGLSRRILGVAAAALVVVSSSITYVATRNIDGSASRPARAASKQPRRPAAGSAGDARPPAPDTRPVAAKAASSAGRTVSIPEPVPSGVAVPAASRGRSASTVTLASATDAPSPSELALAPEIARLQQTLRLRRDRLEPATVKVVEDNLKLIDAALKQARAALDRDPASGFLTEQLDNVLRKKVQLLRTVALLPSRS